MINLENANTEYLRILANEAKTLPDGVMNRTLVKSPDSWSPYYKFLHKVAQEFKPDYILECGVCRAVATGHMAFGNPDAIVVGVDRDYQPEAFQIAATFPNIHLITGDTMLSVKEVEEIIPTGKLGLIFLDSTHLSWVPMAEFNTYLHLFEDTCIVAADDVNIPPLQEFWDWLPGDKMRMDDLHYIPGYPGDQPGFGVSVVTK